VTALLKPLVFLLCSGASLLCFGLLVRTYLRTGTRLLLWSSLCFAAFALNNLLLLADVVLFPSLDLLPFRLISSLAAVSLLLYGFIRDAE
jgi:hypothetical protein